MFKFMRITLAIGLALGLAASQASASKKIQGTLSKCVKTVEAELVKNERAVISLFQKCEQGIEKCLTKTSVVGDEDRAECITKITTAGKNCSSAKLSLTDTTAKAGKAISKMKAKIDGKCNATLIADPLKLNNTDVMDIDPDNLTFATPSDPNNVYGGGFSSFFFTSGCEPADSTEIDDCAEEELVQRVKEGIAAMDPRGWALLNAAGLSNSLNVGGLGVHNASGITAAGLKLFGLAGPTFSTLPLTPSFATKLRIGSVDASTGVAPVEIRADDSAFGSVVVSGNIVCVEQPNDGEGKLCCAPDCSGDMGAMDSTTHQVHDSSGVNVALGFFGGAVNSGGVVPDDAGCTDQVLNTHGGLTAVDFSTACSEDEARIGACNQDTIGSLAGGGGAHYPICIDGPREGKPCSVVGQLAHGSVDECGTGSVIGCGYPWAGCTSGTGTPATDCPGGAASLLVGPMCNSPVYVVSSGASATEGDLALGLPIQFTIFPVTLAAAFAGTDGIVCTDDDTAPAGDTNSILTTTGSAQSNVYDQNGIPYAGGANPIGLPGINASVTVTGATTDCKTIASSVLTGTVSAGSFSANDGALGDTTTTITLAY